MSESNSDVIDGAFFIVERPLRLVFGRVIALCRLRLDHDGGVASLVVLGLVCDCPDDVARVEADGSAKGGKCGNKHRHDDFDKFDI